MRKVRLRERLRNVNPSLACTPEPGLPYMFYGERPCLAAVFGVQEGQISAPLLLAMAIKLDGLW